MPSEAPPPCDLCVARCCRQSYTRKPFAVILDEAKDTVADFPEAITIPDPDDFMSEGLTVRVLPYVDGKCLHLDEDTNRCMIYDRRPHRCRTFNCRLGIRPHGSLSTFLEDNPDLLKLIESHPRSE